MTSDIGNDEALMHMVSEPQIIMSDSVVFLPTPLGGSGRVSASSATVELGRRLLLAARAGDAPLVLDLMAKGAPFTTDWLGTTPLHLAAGGGHADICGVLLRAGFSRDARSKVRRTPLHCAAAAGHAGCARALLAGGAAPDARDMLRMTPLHWAAQRGHGAAAAELLRRGADPNARSKFGKTPRDLALAAGRADLVRLMDDAALQRAAAAAAPPHHHDQMQEETKMEPRFETVQKLQEIKNTKLKPPEKVIRLHTNMEDIKPTKLKRTDLIKLLETSMSDQGHKSIETIVDQTDVPMTKSQPQVDSLPRIQETKTKPQLESIKIVPQADEGPSGSEAGAALLRAHGITLLPPDTGGTVLSALQSGRTVVLSDAGKLMLKESSSPAPASVAGAGGVVLAGRPVRAPRAGVKVFALSGKLAPRADVQVKLVPVRAGARPGPASSASPAKRARPTVKIILNKTGAGGARLADSTGGARLADNTGGARLGAGSDAVDGGAEDEGAEAASGAPAGLLRAQLQAAQRTIAGLRAELRAARDRISQLENQLP